MEELTYNTTRKGVPELRGPALVCLSAIEQKSVYWSSSWARILNVYDVYYSHHHRRCWPTFIQYLSKYVVPDTEDVGLPIKFQFNVGPALQPIAGSMSVNHRVCCILCANTWHSTNTVSMLTNSLRRWPVIETALGDCRIMLVVFKIPAPETPDNTIH